MVSFAAQNISIQALSLIPIYFDPFSKTPKALIFLNLYNLKTLERFQGPVETLAFPYKKETQKSGAR